MQASPQPAQLCGCRAHIDLSFFTRRRSKGWNIRGWDHSAWFFLWFT